MRSPAHFDRPSAIRPAETDQTATKWVPDRAAPRIGEMLQADGLLDQDDLDKALAFQADYGGRLGSILVRMGALSESDLLVVLARQLAMPVLEPEDMPKTAQPFA